MYRSEIKQSYRIHSCSGAFMRMKPDKNPIENALFCACFIILENYIFFFKMAVHCYQAIKEDQK